MKSLTGLVSRAEGLSSEGNAAVCLKLTSDRDNKILSTSSFLVICDTGYNDQ